MTGPRRESQLSLERVQTVIQQQILQPQLAEFVRISIVQSVLESTLVQAVAHRST